MEIGVVMTMNTVKSIYDISYMILGIEVTHLHERRPSSI